MYSIHSSARHTITRIARIGASDTNSSVTGSSYRCALIVLPENSCSICRGSRTIDTRNTSTWTGLGSRRT